MTTTDCVFKKTSNEIIGSILINLLSSHLKSACFQKKDITAKL